MEDDVSESSFAKSVDDEILDWIRDAAAVADSWSSIGDALRTHDPQGEDPRLRPFVFAFAYTLHERFSSSRERAGGPYGAMIAGDGWRFPPSIEEIDDEDVEAWRSALAAIEQAVVRARLGDLLWVRKSRPDPHLAARVACDALLDVAENPAWRAMDRVHGLSRALELARETRDAGRIDTVIGRMLGFAERDLDSAGAGPGLPLGTLRPLVELSATDRPEGLDMLLERVAVKYGSDPFIFGSVVEMRSRLADHEGRQVLARQLVQRWREESTKGDGMLRVHRLEQALEVARNQGLRGEADELRRELSLIGPEELRLERISAEVKIPETEIERFLDRFGAAATWQEALRLLGAQGPPGGQPEELADRVGALMNEHPVQFLFTKAIVGPDNASTVFRAATLEDHRRLALSEWRAQEAQMWGVFCAEALVRIGQRPDRPDRSALTQFLVGDLIEVEVAERLARGIELFWDEEYDESAHVVVPRLERTVRELARQVGVPVVREPRPDREFGGVEALGGVLRDLEGAFANPGWHAYFLNLLADPLGLNLRNSIAHGLHGTVGPVDASLLVQTAIVLAGMSLRPVENPPEPPAGAGPSS
ncbi:MAG: hypothetical protein U0R70_11100 [Solirubrobacteraceae bacterium]